jgi:hypothetical protein
MQLVVHPNGTAHCLYSEAIELSALGQLTILRGSHVEPNSAGEWFCDLSPVSGPQLGPFSARSEALCAEEAWLHEFWLTQ